MLDLEAVLILDYINVTALKRSPFYQRLSFEAGLLKTFSFKKASIPSNQ